MKVEPTYVYWGCFNVVLSKSFCHNFFVSTFMTQCWFKVVICLKRKVKPMWVHRLCQNNIYAILIIFVALLFTEAQNIHLLFEKRNLINYLLIHLINYLYFNGISWQPFKNILLNIVQLLHVAIQIIRPKKVVVFPEIGWVKHFLSLTRPHGWICIRTYIFKFKKQ